MDPLISGAQLPALRRALHALEDVEHHPESRPPPGGPVLYGGTPLKIFGREPAVILHALQAVLAFLVTLPALNALGLTNEVSGWVMTIAAGLVALVVAIGTRPLVVSALAGAVQTLLTGFVSFGLPLSEQSTGALVAALNIVLMLLMPLGLTPAVDPAPGFVRAQREAVR